MWDAIFLEVLKSFGILFVVWIILFIYKYSHEESIKSDYIVVISQGLAYSIILALILTSMLGKPSCTDSESDGIRSECIEYADNGYKPTDAQSASAFTRYFILIYVPVIAGALKAKNKDNNVI